MMARRLVLLPPFLLLVSAMATEGMQTGDDPEPMEVDDPTLVTQFAAMHVGVLTKVLPFLDLPDLGDKWKKHGMTGQFVYTLGEPWTIEGVPVVTGFTIKVCSPDIDNFDLEERTWATIINGVDNTYLVSGSSEGLSTRSAVQKELVMQLVKGLMKRCILPVFAVTTFSYDDTSAAAVNRTKFCFVQPSFPSWEKKNFSRRIIVQCLTQFLYLKKLGIPGAEDECVCTRATYLRGYIDGVRTVVLVDWPMQAFP
eukprot:GHVS01093782.1.p1 GENE.GHVS01093782.1~~GHVS01093782.1.p1  ORF type:complete len:254 (+),score=21.68 GHVS01093782.1:35-796(+)